MHKTISHHIQQPQPRSLTAPTIEADQPVIIIPVPHLAAEAPETAPAVDAPVCRPPQQLANSHLMGPQVCLPQQEWDRMKRQGQVLMPDGRSLAENYDKSRTQTPLRCTSMGTGAGTALANWTVACSQ